MKKLMISVLLLALLASGASFADQTPIPTLFGDKPMLISAPIQENVLGFDRLQVADTMKAYGRIVAFETAEEGYRLTIKDEITKKDLTLATDIYTKINTKMFYDLQLGTIIEVFYTGDNAIAINVLDKQSQEGRIFIDGSIESLNETTVTIDGMTIDLNRVTISQAGKRALKVGNRAQLVFLTYENETEYRLKIVQAGDFTLEAAGRIKEINNNPLHLSFLVETEKGDILLHIFDDTMMEAAFSNYHVNDRITFTHSMAMTMSLPPQTTCYSVSLPKQPR
ncbi:hypothetical protein SANA_30360 [Gottschalkiaceae bacterium SANA]|nr:hypothetical protein SANA_30360 [Gottschalkiaceae bacterium SANA]